MPQALSVGVEPPKQVVLNPFLLQPFISAYSIKRKRELDFSNTTAWLTGIYFLHAMNAAFGKGVHYEEKPIDLHLQDEPSGTQQAPREKINYDAERFAAFANQFNKHFNKKKEAVK